MGREEGTVHRWLQRSREGGVEALLQEKPKTGRPKKIEVETVAELHQELRDEEGFSSEQEVRIWSVALKGLEVNSAKLYKIVRYELKAKLKVPRPPSLKQEEGAIKIWKEN